MEGQRSTGEGVAFTFFSFFWPNSHPAQLGQQQKPCCRQTDYPRGPDPCR